MVGDCKLATAGCSLLPGHCWLVIAGQAGQAGQGIASVALGGPWECSGMAPGWRREDPEVAPGATGGPWEGLGGAEEAMSDLSLRFLVF